MRRRLARLLLAVFAPLLVLTALELGLRLAGYGYDPRFFIPGPQAGTLVSSPRFAWRFFGRQRSRAPLPVAFTPAREADTYRIIVLGGSAALGDPDGSVSFARVLEAMLAVRFPETRVEVLNTAMTGINSHVVRPIARECARYDPDLYIVYMGNNEVIGPYGAGAVVCGLQPPLSVIRAGVWLNSLRTGQLIRGLAGRARRAPATPPDRWLGMRMFLNQQLPAGDPRLARLYRNFASNLADVCKAGRQAGVDVILCTVLTNLKDCPPFRSEHGRDAPSALHHYRLGQRHLALGETDQARRSFELARDLDTFRFRADTQINDLVRAVAGRRERRGVGFVDVERGVAASHGIPGAGLLHDHVHMNFAGNYAVASLLFPHVAAKVAGARGDVPGDQGPPSQAECARWLVHTAFNEFQAAKSMAARMSAPPFTPEQGQRAAAEMQRRLAGLTRPALKQIGEQFRTVLLQRPDDLLLRANYANVLYVTQDNAGAIAEYRGLLSGYPFASDWQYFLGDSLAAANYPEEAESWLRAALLQAPSNVEALCALGSLLSRTGRADEAVRHYEDALALDPGSVRARSELARVLREKR